MAGGLEGPGRGGDTTAAGQQIAALELQDLQGATMPENLKGMVQAQEVHYY